MKRVLLVEAPFYAFFEYDLWNYSFSCCYLAGILRHAGHDAYVYDADKYFKKDLATRDRLVMVERQESAMSEMHNEDSYIWKHFIKTLNDIKPDYVVFASWTYKMDSINIAIRLTKEILPECKVAVGGYHVTALPHAFDSAPVDGILLGPAERILLNWIEDGGPKKKYHEEISRETLKISIPPAREALLFPEHFSNADMSLTLLSRGCHHNCSFCTNKMLSKCLHVVADEAYVRSELETIKYKFNCDHLVVIDAHFYNSKSINALLSIIKEYKMQWTCAVRIDKLSSDFVDKLIDAGCTLVFFGLERGRNDLLERVNKKLTIEQIRTATELLTAKKLAFHCSFVAGFPDDDEQSIRDTRDFALSIGAGHISLNSFTPLPGSTLWDELRKDFSEEDLLGYNQLNPVAEFIKKLPREEYSKIFKEVLYDFEQYNHKSKGRDLIRRNQ